MKDSSETTESRESAPERAGASSDSRACYCPGGGVTDLLSRRYATQLICVVGALGPVRYGEIEENSAT